MISKRIKQILFLWLFLFSSVLWGLNVGDVVENTANVSYEVHNYPKYVESNTTTNMIEETEAEIIFQYINHSAKDKEVLGATAYRDGNGEIHLSETERLYDGTVLGDDSKVGLDDAEYYGVRDTAIIKVIDGDQNVDRDVRDYVDVNITTSTGDVEEIRLIESGPNTGVFLGYISLTPKKDGEYSSQLNVETGHTIIANYDDQGRIAQSDSALIVLKKEFKVWLEKEVNKEESTIGELLSYTLRVHNDESFKLGNMTLVDALPLGLKLAKGTVKISGEKVNEKLSEDGKSLIVELPTLPANSTTEVTFLAYITAGVDDGKVVNQAWVKRGEIFRSNIATAETIVKEELMRSEGIVVGKIKNRDSSKGVAGVRLYLEDGTYVVTDRLGKYHFEGLKAGRHVIQVDKALLPKGYKMAFCQESARHAGKDFSQFVNVGRGALKEVNFCLQPVHGAKLDGEDDKAKPFVIPTKVKEMPSYGEKDLNGGESRDILWPSKGHIPFVPSTKIAIKLPKDEHIELMLNGYVVSQMNYDGSVNAKKSKSTIMLYRGVDLLERGNLIKVKFLDKKNRVVKELTRTIYVSSSPVQARYVKEHSLTIADGKASPVIAVKFLDDSGRPLRSGITGTFSVESPYRSQDVLEQMQNNPLAQEATENKYTVHSDGIAYIRLQPTTESGEVTLHFNLQGRDEVIRAWLKPALREWIMVGFAEGTVGYNTLSGHKESLERIGAKEKLIKEGRVSFFAKGRVKGDWLLSMAYDSGKDTSKSQLFDEIDPNQYYTLYGDNTEQYQEASSREKLYVKVEKEQFNLLFGDFNTDLSYTELSAYSRTFTGLKSEYHGANLEAKAFVAYTEQLFMKDEIRGDGTSGYYSMREKNIVHFSEKIHIEVRDRYHREKIVSTVTLQRFKDYEIDYAKGRVMFNEPIFSNDEVFNPRYIVIDYEIKGDGGKHYTYGGRTAVKTEDSDVEVGVSYISEDSSSKSSTLQGVDASVKLGLNTKVRAEYAKSKTTEGGEHSEGEAKLAEVEYIGKGIHTRAYYREQEQAFGLGQLSQSLGATRKVGVDLSQQFDNRQRHQLTAYRESDLESNIDSDVVEFRTQIDQHDWNAFAGYRYSAETDSNGSQQLLFGASKHFFDQKLKLSATREETLGEDESRLFPTKTTLGIDYTLNSSIDVFTNYEWADSKELGRAGVRVRPWSGMTLENSVTSEIENDSRNIYNTLGAVQNIQLTSTVGMSVGFEEGRALDRNSTTEDNSFRAYHLGVNYNNKIYSAIASVEMRDSRDEDKLNLSTAVYRQVNDELALALGGNYNEAKSEDILNKNRREDINLRFSLAYRPLNENRTVLEKLEYIKSSEEDSGRELKSEKMINNMNINFAPTGKSELALQHGIKYVRDRVEEYEYTGLTQLFGVDARYDITPSWEFGLQGSWLYAQSANNSDYGFGIYSGHNLFKNMLLTVGYNWRGFDDDDFSLQTYRVEGPYFRFNMKFDQESLADTVRMLSW